MQWTYQSAMRPLELVKVSSLIDRIVEADLCQAIRLHSTCQILSSC